MTDLTSRLKNALAWDESANALNAGYHSVPVMQANPTLAAPYLLEFAKQVGTDNHARTHDLLLALVEYFVFKAEHSEMTRLKAAVLKELERIDGGT